MGIIGFLFTLFEVQIFILIFFTTFSNTYIECGATNITEKRADSGVNFQVILMHSRFRQCLITDLAYFSEFQFQ